MSLAKRQPQDAIVLREPPKVSEAMAKVLLNGDLAPLTAEQKLEYHDMVCRSLGLNPLTRPFDYIAFQGKVVLYARRDCTEQLRKVHSVSITSSKRSIENDICIFEVTAADRTGRTDTGTGAVNVANLKGADLANAIKKAETQAKRRATLSICGLGMIDESEISDISNAHPLTPGGRAVVDVEPVNVHEENYKRREREAIDKLTPGQKAVLEAKMKKSSPVHEEAGTVAGSSGESRRIDPQPKPVKQAPQVKQEPPAEGTGAAGTASVLYYTWANETARIEPQPDLALTADLKALIKKYWKPGANAAVLGGEELEALRFEFGKRNVTIQRKL